MTKMVFGKSIEKERLRGRETIDKVFIPLMNKVLGDKALIYSAKYTAAKAHLDGKVGSLVSDDDEARAIIVRHEASIDAIADLDKRRQALQSRIDACKTAADIDALLAKVLNT